MKNLIRIGILLVPLGLLLGCNQDSLNDYGSNKTTDFGSVSGLIKDMNGVGLEGVEIAVEESNTYSDQDGYYYLEQVPAGDTILINFSKPNYASTQKKKLISKDENRYVRAVLSSIGVSQDIDAALDNNISFQGAEVDLTGNSLVDENGNPFTGTAKISATYFDPSTQGFGDAFPGDFVGEDQSGNDVAIESYGFISVEIKNGDKNLQLAAGSQASITLPVPSLLSSQAPNQIPLWYYDEEKGTWVEEGFATKQNGKYVGEVSHFSSWNCDMVMETSKITGRVVSATGTPMPGVDVFLDAVDYFEVEWLVTDASGRFTIFVKSDALVDINAETYSPPPISIVECESAVVRVQTPPAGQVKDIGDLVLICPDSTALTNDYYDAFSGHAGLLTYAVGVSGTVLYADVMSGSWNRIAAGTDATLYGIYLADYNYMKGWIVGTNGTVRHSIDYGQTWSTVGIGTIQDLMDVEFIGPYSGLIVGTVGSIFHTTDGGLNWNPVNSGTVQTLHDADYITLEHAWAVGTLGTIINSSDGGASWSIQQSGSVEDLFGVAFVDEQTGWVVGGSGTLLKTTNAGQNWQKVNSGTLEDLNGIDFSSGGIGKIVGNNGVILSTVDGGQNWTIEFEIPKNNLASVRFGGMGAGIIAGDDKLITISSSQNYDPVTAGWLEQNDGVDTPLNDLLVVSANEAWVAGDVGVLLHTTSGGSGWSQVSVGSTENLASIDQQGSNLWIAGSNETILHSDDSGNSWQVVNSDPGGKPAKEIQLVNSSTGYALFSDSLGGQMLKTTNGGLSWSLMAFFPNDKADYFADFEFVDEYNGWMLGKDIANDTDYQFSTTDGGISWQVMDSETNGASDYYDLFFLTPEIGWRSSLDMVFVTSDGGQTWINQLHNIMRTPMKLFFLDYINGWGVSKNKHFISGDPADITAITRTKDGGVSWYYQKTTTGDFPKGLKDVEMANKNVGWAIGGAQGYIYYTNTGGD